MESLENPDKSSSELCRVGDSICSTRGGQHSYRGFHGALDESGGSVQVRLYNNSV